MPPILSVRNLSKSFDALPVIQQVNFDVHHGEVIGITGGIGSGKSVLVMLLAGYYPANQGEIYFEGERLGYPFNAKAMGIGIIHQRPTLADHLDVISNLFLGNEVGFLPQLGLLRVLDNTKMHDQAQKILQEMGVEVNSLNEKVSNLSGEQRQMLAIARVLTFMKKLIIMDEPTVLLGYPNQQKLLSLIQQWRKEGITVLFSTNNLDHLFAVTDRIIILNQGRIVSEVKTDEATRETVGGLLLGSTDPLKLTPIIWDFDSYARFREQLEKLRYHQFLLEKNEAGVSSIDRHLIEQLAEQVQVLDQANLSLLEAQRHILVEREQERKYLSRELHDLIIQDLLSTNYELESIATEFSISDDLADNLTEVRKGIRELVTNLRRICGNLRPPTIDSLGLGAAIKSYVREWQTKSDIIVSLVVDDHLGRLPEATELSLFRIVQEGLNNVRRHASATQVAIVLEHTSPRTLMISIRDNGNGVDEDFDLAALASSGHYGLVGINERVALLGGRLRISCHPEGGTVLLVEIPHPRVEPEA